MDNRPPFSGILLSVGLGLYFLSCPVAAAVVLLSGAGLGLLCNIGWAAKNL